jgi:UDP-glucose 4-epimerase
VVSMAKPLLDATVNIAGGINLCAVAQAAGVSQFVYINTGGALYGTPEYLPMDEEHPIRPTSAYGLSKHTAELYFKMLLPPTIALKVLRLANVYGPRQDPYGEAGVVGIFGARMVRNEPVTIYGDGEQTRDFIYVSDVVDAIIAAVDKPEPLTVNVSLGEPTSVNDIYRMLVQASGYTQPAIYAPERPGEAKHSVLANTRARELLGWTPRTSVEDGLRQTMAWVATDEVVKAGGEQRRDH